jgi:hypothetical protein
LLYLDTYLIPPDKIILNVWQILVFASIYIHLPDWKERFVLMTLVYLFPLQIHQYDRILTPTKSSKPQSCILWHQKLSTYKIYFLSWKSVSIIKFNIMWSVEGLKMLYNIVKNSMRICTSIYCTNKISKSDASHIRTHVQSNYFMSGNN